MTAELNKMEGRDEIIWRASAKRSNGAGTRTASREREHMLWKLSPVNKQGEAKKKSGCHGPLIYDCYFSSQRLWLTEYSHLPLKLYY